MVVDTVEDLLQVFFGIHMEKDETKKVSWKISQSKSIYLNNI